MSIINSPIPLLDNTQVVSTVSGENRTLNLMKRNTSETNVCCLQHSCRSVLTTLYDHADFLTSSPPLSADKHGNMQLQTSSAVLSTKWLPKCMLIHRLRAAGSVSSRHVCYHFSACTAAERHIATNDRCRQAWQHAASDQQRSVMHKMAA